MKGSDKGKFTNMSLESNLWNPWDFIAICREDYLALGSDQGVDGDYYLVVASVITLQIIQEQL